MKKNALFLMMILMATTLAGCGDPCQENVFSKLGDTIATLGKQGLEKDQILVERKGKRAAECAEKSANSAAKKLGL